ncbi:MAG: carboxypeptidase-like regulatory domain-containing protein, partial [Acidobacteriota bacterium]
MLEASEVARDGRLAAGSADTWRWRSAPGDVVRCDLDAYEPLDAACPEAPCPGETTLRLRPGRALELVDSGAPGAVEVEWRRFGEPGAASELVARRRLATPAAPGPRVLYSAAAEDRLLRLRADGGAPETFFVPAALSEGVEADGAALPLAPAWPGAGGELFGFIEAGGSWPTALRLSDAKTVHELTIDEWGQFGASGLPPGRYQLRATFRGGWRTEGPTIRVEEGETVELLPWGLSPSGGVDLDLGPGLCAEATAAGTLRVRFGHRRERDRVLELDPEVCRHRVEGLAPGQWRLVLDRAAESDTAMRRRSDRPSSTASVEIVAGEIAWATLTKPAVRVTGRVTAGGEGLPGVGVRVAPAPRDGASPAATPTSRDDFGGWTGSAETEADGVFTLEARAPGPAVLHLFSEDGFPVVSRDVELVVGTVRQDFDLGDGRIRVSVSSAEGRPAGPVTLEAWDVAGHRLVRTGSLEADQESTLIFGLEFGRYELNAFTEGGLATLERPQVELSKLRPDGEAELVLEKQRAVATVLDANG